jgi:hypothetical protein
MMSKVTALSLIVTMAVFLSSCENGSESFQGLSFQGHSFQGHRFQGLSFQNFLWDSDTSGTVSVFKVASGLESAADKLYSHSLATYKQLSVSNESDTKSCDMEDTAVITVYSTNGRAQTEIDVTLDGGHVGSLTTYFPNDEPSCKTPSAEGVITLMVPAGTHTLEAASGNVIWPSHVFSVETCGCMVLPLS